MNSFLILAPLLVVLAAFTYGVGRSILHVWLQHRLKLALLDKYEQNPALFASSREALDALARPDSASSGPLRQDYTLTGILLSLLGIGCVIAGRVIGLGKVAVGIYIGGMVCIVLGVLITLLGFLIRALAKNGLAEAGEN